MTQIIGASANTNQNSLSIMGEDDDRLKPEYATYKHPSVVLRDAAKDASGISIYTSCFWPGSGGHPLLGDAGDVNVLSAQWYDLLEITHGQKSAYFFSGYARNASGTPTSGVTLKLFLTSTDQVVSQTTSGTDGSYSLSTGFGGAQHYIVAYLSGGGTVPDIEGTTVNTLVPGIPGA